MSLTNLLNSDYNEYFGEKYKSLNNINKSKYGDTSLQQRQIKILRGLEKSNNGLKNANALIEDLKNNAKEYKIDQDKIVELSLDQIATRVLEILNAAFWGNPEGVRKQNLELKSETGKYGYRPGKDNTSIQQEYVNLANELDKLLEILEYPPERREEVVKTFKKTHKGFKKQEYTQFKADEAEFLMMHAIMSANKDLEARVTGKYTFEGKEIIQDGLVYDKNKGFKEIEKELEKITHNYNNKTYTISQEIDLPQLLDKAYAKIQGKSGYGDQPLLNEGERAAISIAELIRYKRGGNQPLKILQNLLQEINKSKDSQFSTYFNSGETSQTLSQLANYALTEGIAKTAIMSNDIYFTHRGFETAASWMEGTNHLLKFGQSTKHITDDFFIRRHKYYLRKLNKT